MAESGGIGSWIDVYNYFMIRFTICHTSNYKLRILPIPIITKTSVQYNSALMCESYEIGWKCLPSNNYNDKSPHPNWSFVHWWRPFLFVDYYCNKCQICINSKRTNGQMQSQLMSSQLLNQNPIPATNILSLLSSVCSTNEKTDFQHWIWW